MNVAGKEYREDKIYVAYSHIHCILQYSINQW